MDEIFINIMERIAGEMPELSLIDEDCGQLEMAEDDHYPVTFPCVLIGNVEAEWREQGLNNQKGWHWSPCALLSTATTIPITRPGLMERSGSVMA